MAPNWDYKTPCVIEGSPSGNGYMQIRVDGKQVYAHRLAWTRTHGEIPAGMHVHHRCGDKRCSAVEHLELLTPKEHYALNRKCDHEERYWKPDGKHSYCRVCHNERMRQRYQDDPAFRERQKAKAARQWRERRAHAS